MPSISQLNYVIAVARARHFGRAARACHVSQPALSSQIQKLEDELGLTIFDRSKKPVLVTEPGKEVLKLAETIVREHQRLLHYSETRGTEPSGQFTLALIPTVAAYLLPLFLDDFAQHYPEVDLRVVEMETAELVAAALEDRIDAGIAATPLKGVALRSQPLFYETFFAYMSKGHPLLKRKSLRESMLDRSDLWLLEDGHCLRGQVVQSCSVGKGSSAYANIRFEAGSLETLRQVVREGRGYTLVPRLFVEQLPASEREAHVRPLARPVPTRELSLVFRRDHLKTKVMEALAAAVVRNLPEDIATARRAAFKVVAPASPVARSGPSV